MKIKHTKLHVLNADGIAHLLALMVIVMIVASVGTYMLVASKAAVNGGDYSVDEGSSDTRALNTSNGDFEAESITTVSSKNIKPYNDSTASGGKALQFYVNGTATRTTTTPNVTKVTVFARGTQCGVAPRMIVKIAGVEVINASVTNTTSYGAYSANTVLAAGSRSVQIAFTNDSATPCDINLIVDRVEFTPGNSPTACDTAAPLPTNADPGTLVLADGFESGNFSKWTTVTQHVDATAVIQAATVKTNNCAAKIHVTTTTGSRANIAKTLPAASKEVWATGWFNVTRQGADTASNVPTFRLFNGTTRILDVSRQNGSGVFFVRWPTAAGSSWNSTGRTLSVNQWYQIKVHAVANGSQSQVRVWLDGVQVFNKSNSTTGFASFGSFTSISSLQIGAEHVIQDGDFVADDVVAKVLQ